MRNKLSPGDRCFDIANGTAMVLLMAVTLYPFLHVAFSSLSNPSLLVRHQGILLRPLGLTLGAYRLVVQNPMIGLGYLNTLFYVVVGTTLNVLLTALSAYVLSRKGFLLRDALMFLAVFTMFFSGGLIPYYLQVRSLGLADSRWALILPTAMSVYNLILMRTSFLGVPDSLEESAKMDGAGDFTVLFRIILPLSLPVVAVMVLYYSVAHWNSWFQAMIFLRDRGLYPLQLILREILISSSTDTMLTSVGGGDKELVGETVKYATIMVATVPILAVYPFLQKYFVKGMMIGAIKG